MSYQKNQSLADGIEVLSALAAAGAPIGSRELARMLEMEPTRANRILKTLAEIGMAEQDSNRKYLSGSGIHILASLCLKGSRLLKSALPIMESQRNPDYLMALGVLWRDKVSYLIHAGPRGALSQGLGHTTLYPAEQSSIGRVLMGPPKRRGYAAVRQGRRWSVAVPVGGARPMAGLAYAGVPKDRIKGCADELKAMADEIDREIERTGESPGVGT